jgi:hypothetical protein
MDNLNFDETGWPISNIPEYTEEDRLIEEAAFKKCCGSCENFINYHGEAGFCKNSKLKPCDPKAMIDMFKPKCRKWKNNL